jgi:hypothetical protein
LPPQPAFLQTKVWLQGAYSPAQQQMTTALTAERLLPLQAPYATPVQLTSLANDLVDWALLELKAPANNQTVISQVVLLRKDGLALDPATLTPSLPLSIPAGPYYIVIRHRNHLPAMSARPYFFSNGILTFWDSSQAGQTMGQNGTALLAPMIYGLWAGDLNGDGQVTATDSETWFGAAVQAAAGYTLADINLDGQVTTGDFTFFHHNIRLLAQKGF